MGSDGCRLGELLKVGRRLHMLLFSTEKGWKSVPLGNLNLFPNLNPTEPELSEEINLFQVLLFQKLVFNLLLNYYTHTVKAKTLSIVQFVTFFQGGINDQFD